MTRPMPTGPYKVGTMTFTIYNDRPETFPGFENEMRSIPARVYYPTANIDGCEKEKGLSEAMCKGIKKAFFIPLDYAKMEASGDNVSECYVNAPKIEGEKFPVILFSHGYQSYREGNSFLCIDIASHGYVVIAIAHSHEAIVTELDDGTKVACKGLTSKMYKPMIPGLICAAKMMKRKGTNEELAQKFDEMQFKYCTFIKDRVSEWEKDTEAVIRYLKENLTDMIDLGNGIGIAGHSMGGAVAYAMCHRNSDITCGINIDGGLFGEGYENTMTKPFLQVNCEDNVNMLTRGWYNTSAPAYRVLFKNMKHQGFSDMKFAINAGIIGKMDAQVMHDGLCKTHVEFFDTYLKKLKDAPDLPESDEIIVTRFA